MPVPAVLQNRSRRDELRVGSHTCPTSMMRLRVAPARVETMTACIHRAGDVPW